MIQRQGMVLTDPLVDCFGTVLDGVDGITMSKIDEKLHVVSVLDLLHSERADDIGNR